VKALLIAGGRGTRIRALAGDAVPKALVPVAGIPAAARLLELLSRHGVKDVGVMAGHLAGRLAEGLAPWARKLGTELSYFVEEQPLGTAGGLWEARGFVGGEDFLVLYADIVADVDLGRLIEFHRSRGGAATVTCHPNDHPHDSDLFDLDEVGRVRKVLPARGREPGDFRNCVPAAIYAASTSLFDFVEQGVPQEFIHDVFPRVAKAGLLYGYNTPEYMRDMGSGPRFAMAERDVESGRVAAMRLDRKRPAIFFDRDGVLNEEVGGQGLVDVADFRMIPGAAEAVRRVNDAGWLAVGVTNQPQLAKGFLTPEGLGRIHARLDTLLGEKGARLDRLFFCPHHPDSGFPGEIPELKVRCDCRKPLPGMLLRAASELPVDLPRSSMIGDSWRDVGAARSAGVWAYTVRTGVGGRGSGSRWRPDATFDDVSEAVDFLLSGIATARPLASVALKKRREDAKPLVVGISGPPRAGKSVLSHALVRLLADEGCPALHVRMDDWIVARSMRKPGMPSAERCNVEALPRVVGALLRGERVSAEAYDPWSRETSDGVSYEVGKAQVVILDGIWACHDGTRPMIDLAVWMETPFEVLESRLRTFLRWKGDGPETIDVRCGRSLREEVLEAAVQRPSVNLVWEPSRTMAPGQGTAR
jgi:mannose-1-phosphate guanylyltransferase/phosphomannomutase